MTQSNHQPADMARLRWQCRRGMLELDEMLLDYLEGPFLRASAPQQADFRDLLRIEDPQLNQWLILGHAPSDPRWVDIVAVIRAAAGLGRP
jgi:antitoxin CptB